MRRLIKQNINTKEEYDRIYDVREARGIDLFDERRWKKLLKYYRGGWLTDFGCLDSQIPSFIDQKDYIGIDIAPHCIEEMKKKYPDATYFVRDVNHTGFKDNSIDYAVAGELLEHLESPTEFLDEAFRVLKPKGTLAISVPYNETERGEVDHERHLWSFNRFEIKDLLHPYGKTRVTIMGSTFFPYRYHFPNLIAYCCKN